MKSSCVLIFPRKTITLHTLVSFRKTLHKLISNPVQLTSSTLPS